LALHKSCHKGVAPVDDHVNTHHLKGDGFPLTVESRIGPPFGGL
jgi:hypothetical protein